MALNEDWFYFTELRIRVVDLRDGPVAEPFSVEIPRPRPPVGVLDLSTLCVQKRHDNGLFLLVGSRRLYLLK